MHLASPKRTKITITHCSNSQNIHLLFDVVRMAVETIQLIIRRKNGREGVCLV